MNGTLTKEEHRCWTKAWERSLASGDDHGWAANAADNAVIRLRKRKGKKMSTRTPHARTPQEQP